jgi:hypothetical protein
LEGEVWRSGQGLGYEYPLDLDERVTADVQKMQLMR